ncbi:MAG: methyltransferase [Candidatus Acidiferrales bacterium]
MKHVLHGYIDDVAAKILRNTRAVIPRDGMLLVLEFVLPDVISQPDPHLEGRLIADLNMMAVTGGKERSAAEWKPLLAAGGFELRRITPVVAKDQSPQNVAIVEGVSIIEAAPA